MIKRQECWEQKPLLPMHEHRFLIADHNLPGPSECEGPRQFPSFADTDADGMSWQVEFMCVAVTNRWPETVTKFIGPNASR